MTIDKKIIEYNVYCIGGYIGTHSNLGVTSSTLGSVNTHLYTVKYHTTHDYLEISNGTIMCFCCGTT